MPGTGGPVRPRIGSLVAALGRPTSSEVRKLGESCDGVGSFAHSIPPSVARLQLSTGLACLPCAPDGTQRVSVPLRGAGWLEAQVNQNTLRKHSPTL